LRELLIRQLSYLGCTSRVSGDAGEFLSIMTMSREAFDLAIIDIQLPGLNGDKLISWLRGSELPSVRSIPILIVTGYPHDLPEGVVPNDLSAQVLSKPYTLADLKDAIRALTVFRRIH